MELLLYTIRVRLTGQFFNRAWWRTLIKVLLFLVAGMYAYGFAKLFDIIQREAPEFPRELILAGFCAAVLFITIVRGYFPTYQPQQDFIPKLYPVGQVLRYFTGLASELVSAYFLIMLWVIGVITAASDTFTLQDAALALTVLYSAHLIRRVLQTHTDRQLNRQAAPYYLSIVMGLAGAVLLVAGLYGFSWLQPWATFALPFALPILLGADYLASRCVIAIKAAKAGKGLNDKRNIFSSLLFRSNSTRISILFNFVFKVLGLGIAAGAILSGRPDFFRKQIFIMLLITPVMLFTYVFNNTWGHFRNFWLTLQLSGAGVWEMARVQFRLLAVPLLIDAFIALIFLAFLNEHRAFFVLFYLASLALLFPVSMIASVYQPKLILKFNYMRQTSSVLFNFITLGGVGLLLLPLAGKWLYFGYPVLISFAWFAAIAVLKEYPRFQYKIYEKLFKTSD